MEIRTERPKKDYVPMDRTDRAKLFAPFAALGSMDGILASVCENRQTDAIDRISNLEDFNYMCAEDMDFEEA